MDKTARIIAATALAVALASAGGFTYGRASADATTEPDAAALAPRVADLEAQVATLEDQSTFGCLAFSDFHYYRERVDGSHRRWRLPVMLWNMADPSCRPTPAVWTPRHRYAATSRAGSAPGRLPHR